MRRGRGQAGPVLLLPGLLLLALDGLAHRVDVPGPDAGTRRYGADIVRLDNGNYVVTDPDWSGGEGVEFAGAVYLHAADGTLISRLSGGAAGDRIGSGGILALPGGHVLVRSPLWDASPTLADVGAVTFGDAVTGFGPSAEVGPANSLVGSSAGDRVGEQPVVVLDDGSYVVPVGEWDLPGGAANVGAVKWCAPTGCIGEILAAQAVTGTAPEDRVGGPTVGGAAGVVKLANGHYVVVSSNWDNGPVVNAGAVTWARSDGSTVGPVSAANSIVGSSVDDYVGAEVQALTNGHYIVQSWLWDNGATANVGAVTWADGSMPSAGAVGAANSLIGSREGDRVGYLAAMLGNGHYVVVSPLWDLDAVVDAGAVTWRDGSAASPGVVDADNSLVGSQRDDTIGLFATIGIPPLGVIPLPNGHYVVASPSWDDGARVDVGAATWVDGTQTASGPLSVQNSLIGAAAGDAIAQYIVTLENGDYVVASPYWSESRGAATWGSAADGVTGVVDASNSLVGVLADDFVTAFGVYPLADGGYAVPTPRWSNGDTLRVGAVTRAAAGVGVSGPVSAANSIVGVQRNDGAGARGVVALPDGGFLVQSPLGTGAGAITRFPGGASPVPDRIEPARSLVGKVPVDRIGTPGVSVEADGTLVLRSATADAQSRGAVTLLAADDPLRGFLFEPDTVRSAVDGGGPQLNHAWLPASGTLLVGDPAANRVVRLSTARVLRDGFE